MARINFEDEIAIDHRFRHLVRKVGDEDKANGMLLRFWRIAQRYWGQGELVPKKVFELEELHSILECDLAEERPDGIYAKGTEKRFQWYVQKCDASKKGVQARKNSNRDTSAGQPADHSRSTESSAPVNPLVPTLAPVPVPTQNTKILLSEGRNRSPLTIKPATPGPARAGPYPVNRFIAAYIQAFQANPEHGKDTRPHVGGKVQGLMRQLLKDYPIERLELLIQTYCQMTDPWFKTKGWDFLTFHENIGKIGVALDKGRDSPYRRTWRDIVDEQEREAGVGQHGTRALPVANGSTEDAVE